MTFLCNEAVYSSSLRVPIENYNRVKEIELIESLGRIGLSIDLIDTKNLENYDPLIEAFKKIEGVTDNVLTKEDIEFFRIYEKLFNKIYFKDGTVSGYVNYGSNPYFEKDRINAVIKEMRLKKGDRVLDIGCAMGGYVRNLRLNGIDAKGIDISSYAIEQADAEIRKHLFLFDRLDVLNQFEPGSFDLILLKDVLEHIPEAMLPRFWSTIKRLGKRALVVIPITDSQGRYINPQDKHDLTHLIKREKEWWISKLGDRYEEIDEVNLAFKNDKAKGTFCAVIPLDDKRASLFFQQQDSPVKIALVGTSMIRAEPIKKEDYYKGKIQKKILSPPIGIYRLQYFLQEMFEDEFKEGKLKIDVFDPAYAYATDTIDSLLAKLSSEGYHFIGFSPIRVLLGEDLFFMNKVYEMTRNSEARPMFFAGGNEASLNSQILFETMPWLDFCIYGLGEPVLRDVLAKIYKDPRKGFTKEDFYDVPGIIHYEDSKVLKVPPKVTDQEIKNFSKYIPSNVPYQHYWDLADADNLEGIKNTKVIRIFMSNYCPYKCAFCSDHKIGRDVFGKNVAPVTSSELSLLIRRLYREKGAEGIYFSDDDLFVDKNRAGAMLKEIIKMKKQGEIPVNMKFYGQTRVDKVDDELLSLAKEAGFVYLGFGVESFSDESLSGPDLNKGFEAETAFNSVTSSLHKRIPITNINLILFHPTISRKSFITTVEKTVELLRESIKCRAELSVNSFPVIEAYAGAAINKLADEQDWPKEKESVSYGGRTWEYVLNYLPIDEKMRKVVEGGRLMEEFQRTMKEITKDKRWPATTVSRSIGINGLAMFIAAYKLLGINKDESSVSIGDMEELIWRLIETFHNVEEASKVLAAQNANIVFTRHNERFIFRRGAIPLLEIPVSVTENLGKKCSGETLIDLKNANFLDIKQALQDILSGNSSSFPEAFSKYGIRAYMQPNFKKVLLVASYGNTDGSPLKTAVPHPGLERLSYYILRNTENTDCRVFNPNLVGRDKLKEIIKNEFFDVIGFNFMPVTLRNDAQMIDMAAIESPNSILVAGGINIRRLPHEEVFGIIPFDVFMAGPGEKVFSEMMDGLIPSSYKESKRQKLVRFKTIPNLYVYDRNNVTKTKQTAFHFEQIKEEELKKDIPYLMPDVIHGTTYERVTKDIHSDILPFDMIGTKRLYVKISDRCKGNCVFCSAPKEKIENENINNIIEAIRNGEGMYDSVHFSDNDLVGNRDIIEKLCERIIEEKLQKIPKVCKSRTDDVDPEILSLLAKAGFKIITYGIESFNNEVLEEMKKGVTEEQNQKALRMTLDAGMKPGMDMIFFSPWETPTTLLDSVEKALEYVEKGAYLNCTTAMYTQLGDMFSSKLDRQNIQYQELQFKSTGKTFLNPERIILSNDMEDLREKVLREQAMLEDSVKEKYAFTHHGYISFSIESLLFCKAVYEIFSEREFDSIVKKKYEKRIDYIDVLIDRTITLEEQRMIVLPEIQSRNSFYSTLGMVEQREVEFSL